MNIKNLITELGEIQLLAQKYSITSTEKFFLLGNIYGTVSKYFELLKRGEYTVEEFEQLRELLASLKSYIPSKDEMADNEMSVFAQACRINLQDFIHHVEDNSLSDFMKD